MLLAPTAMTKPIDRLFFSSASSWSILMKQLFVELKHLLLLIFYRLLQLVSLFLHTLNSLETLPFPLFHFPQSSTRLWSTQVISSNIFPNLRGLKRSNKNSIDSEISCRWTYRLCSERERGGRGSRVYWVKQRKLETPSRYLSSFCNMKPVLVSNQTNRLPINFSRRPFVP